MTKIIDFNATWCGPCKAQKPILEKFAKENSDTVQVRYVDVEDSPAEASKYGIRAVPTLVLVDAHGNVEKTLVGLQIESKLKQLIS